MSYKIILENRSLGVTQGTVSVCGHSRRHLGYSRFDDRRGCHVVEMTPEEYAKAANDLSRNWHKSRAKWVPYFVEIEEPAKVVTAENNPQLREMALNMVEKLSTEDIKRIAVERGLIITAVPIEQPVVANPEPALHQTLPDSYWALIKLAKTTGANVEGIRKIPELKAAILAHQQKAA